MIQLQSNIKAADLTGRIDHLWKLSVSKIRSIDATHGQGQSSPVFTVEGQYTSKGWTEWTQGFQIGSAILQFDATGDSSFLDMGRERTLKVMAPHVSHIGVHDHGFNNVSTYGNLLRLMHEGRIEPNACEQAFYEMALKTSGAVQAARWRETDDGLGYIYSFNGPHSLFSDTLRSLRSLVMAHQLGHVLLGENDVPIDLLDRALQHAKTTARYNVYYGDGRDAYDVPGRVVHESIFNVNDGKYRCPSSQQGYSPFTTWTRGLAWVMLGYAEQLEYLQTRADDKYKSVKEIMLKAACVTCDFYIDQMPTDGIPYWDTGAPGLQNLGDYQNNPADPFNKDEPVDSSAAAIAAQGLLRLGHYLKSQNQDSRGDRYWQAGLVVLQTLLGEPYLSTSPKHQGLLLHAIYHHPCGWDHVPNNAKIPQGESCMWGDYHLMEAALYLQRMIRGEPYYTFFTTDPGSLPGSAPGIPAENVS